MKHHKHTSTTGFVGSVVDMKEFVPCEHTQGSVVSSNIYAFHRKGIVTRCPLELKMKRKKEGEEWYGKISYQDHEEDLDDPEKVEAKIREGNSNHSSSQLLVLHI